MKCSCGTSTGICGTITRGTGELDFNGYWEHPCTHGNAYEDYKPSLNQERQDEVDFWKEHHGRTTKAAPEPQRRY